LLWLVTAVAAAVIFLAELFFMPASLLKIVICAVALVIAGVALFKRGRRRRRV